MASFVVICIDKPDSLALRLATRGGGEALGLPVGALEVGRPADVIEYLEWCASMRSESKAR